MRVSLRREWFRGGRTWRPPRPRSRSRSTCPSTAPLRRVRPRERVARVARAGEHRPQRPLIGVERRHRHHAREREDRSAREAARPRATSRRGSNPPFVSSPTTLTCTSASIGRPGRHADLVRGIREPALSSECRRSNRGRAFTLFRCRCPMRCHRTGTVTASIFGSASCTRFSPTSPRPASHAACHRVGSVRLGYRHDLHRLAVTGPSHRGVDSVTHLAEPVREVRKRHNVATYRRLQVESREASWT